MSEEPQISLADPPEVAHAAGELKTPDHLRWFSELADTARGRGSTFGEYPATVLGRRVDGREGSRHPASGFAVARRTFRESRCSGTSTSAINSSCSGRC